MNEAQAETIAVLKSIPGGKRLLDWLGLDYGGMPPEFGDAEIVSLLITQGGESGLTLKVDRYRRDQTPPLNEEGIIRFVFSDVVGIQLDDILVHDVSSGPNVIEALYLRLAAKGSAHPASIGLVGGHPNHEIEVEPIAGAHGIIRTTISRIELDIRSTVLADK